MDAVVQAVLVWLSKHFAQEQQVITSAPVAFAVCVGLASTAILFILRWHFKHELSARDGTIKIHEERHKQKDEKIADFLSRATWSSPEQLAAQIEGVKRELAQLKVQAWRTITPEQRQTIDKMVGSFVFANYVPPVRPYISIRVRHDNAEARRYGREFGDVLQRNGIGWGISEGADIPLDLTDIVIRVAQLASKSPIVECLSRALTKAEIEHRIDVMTLQFPVMGECELIVGRNGAV